MKHAVLIGTIALLAMVRPWYSAAQTQQDKAGARVNDLCFASYVTSRQVEQLATNQDIRTKALQIIKRMGITKLYLEAYRSGHVGFVMQNFSLVPYLSAERNVMIPLALAGASKIGRAHV